MADKTFTYGPDNTDQLLATTLSAWASENLEDEVFKVRPLYKKLHDKARTQDGGVSILLPVMYAKNGTAQSYDEYDILDITPQDGFTNTQALWKNLAVSISIAGVQMNKNSGVSQVINLLDAKTKQAVESLVDLFSEQLFASSPGSKDVTSLPKIFSTSTTIQDVSGSSNSWWQATVVSGGSFATQGLDDMRTSINTVDEFNPASTLDTVVTTTTIKNYYEASMTPNMRFTSAGVGDPTFSGLQFRATEIFSDPNAPSGEMYMFSTEDLFLFINSNANMKTTEFVKPATQIAKVAQIIITAELMTRARRKLVKITGISA